MKKYKLGIILLAPVTFLVGYRANNMQKSLPSSHTRKRSSIEKEENTNENESDSKNSRNINSTETEINESSSNIDDGFKREEKNIIDLVENIHKRRSFIAN